MKLTKDYVFFWTAKDIYSNFYHSPFKHQDILFQWSEQAVMYRKAKLFGADDVANEILKAKNPIDCKHLGRSPQIPFDETIWAAHREQIYKEVLIDKFSLPNLKQQLLATGSRKFVEASPYDGIWGIKMSVQDEGIENPANWKGLNLLGKVLDEVKEALT